MVKRFSVFRQRSKSQRKSHSRSSHGEHRRAQQETTKRIVSVHFISDARRLLIPSFHFPESNFTVITESKLR